MSNLIQGTISSKALYSSWCHMPFQDAMFDAGEGAATSIGNGLFNVTRLFIGHDHGDHTLGLPSIIGCRNAGRGMSRNEETRDHNKPLEVFFPEDNFLMNDLIDFIDKRNKNWLRYDLRWTPIVSGFELEINKNTFVRAISMQHQKRKSTLGYVIYENRKRLKEKYRGANIPLLKKQNGLTDADLMEVYRHNLFAYCLDAYKIDNPNEIRGCDKVVMDCTFLDVHDRDDMTHFTLDEALSVCQDMGVKEMYAAHLSPRYHKVPVPATIGGVKIHIVSNDDPYPIG